MTDELSSSEIRTRQFDVVRKGYDRNQVELFLAQIGRQFDSLETKLGEAADSDISLGIDDSEALARELASIGDEINVILESARSTAESIRVRATTDAESWTSEAKSYVEESTSEADTQAHAARGSAWDEGSSMLAAATEEATRMVAEAETDALRIRAEAEREAIRYTADAKRAGEEAIGAAENEAEGILSTSRAESDRVLRAANQSAELAQERARALEDRRSELLSELESTRSSIGELETEFESKRQALEEPEPVVTEGYEERTHHEPDGGSVKIVSGSKVIPLKPVDADSFVAEVVEMHRSVEDSREDSRQPSDSSLPQLAGGDVEVRDRGGSPADSRQPEEDEVPDSSLPQLAGGDVEEQPTADSQQPEEEQPAGSEQEVDSIGSLFAQLREGSEQSPVDGSQSEESRQPSAVSDQPASEPVDTQLISETEDGERTADSSSLIPVQNAALRTIKRQLVDLQNDALEHLRTDEAWDPTEEFTDRFSEPFGELASAITADRDDGGAASVFATDLYDAVSSAVLAAREAGSGDRAIAAATSKVFRTWRSDEAERRVVAVATELSERS